MRVSAAEGHRIWSATYDANPNPLLSLDTRILSEQLGDLRGLRMIDVACGTGRWMMAAQAQGAEIAGIDFSKEMLAVAALKPSLKGRLVLAEAGWLPFADGIADLALCSMALNYFPSIPEALGEMARVVRSGGRVAVSDIHPEASAAGWKRSFRANGAFYEMDHDDCGADELNEAAEVFSLVPAWQMDAYFGMAEREIFQRADKLAVFADLSRRPALHMACWTKL